MNVEVNIPGTKVTYKQDGQEDIDHAFPEGIVEVIVPDDLATNIPELISRLVTPQSFVIGCHGKLRDAIGKGVDGPSLNEMYEDEITRRLNAALAGQKLTRGTGITKETKKFALQIIAMQPALLATWCQQFGVDHQALISALEDDENIDVTIPPEAKPQ